MSDNEESLRRESVKARQQRVCFYLMRAGTALGAALRDLQKAMDLHGAALQMDNMMPSEEDCRAIATLIINEERAAAGAPPKPRIIT